MNNEVDQELEPTVDAEQFEFDEAAREQPVLAGHQWRQRGVVVSCTSCPFEHSFMVGPDVTLTGLDSHGYPTFMTHE